MSRRFEVTVTSPASVEAILAAFAQSRYWHDRFEAFGGGIELSSLDRHPDGTITVATVQDVRREAMHPLVAKLYARRPRVLAEERWTPAPGGADASITVRADASITVRVDGAPGQGHARAALRPAGTGSELRMDGAVTVSVPLLGGPIERVVASRLATHVPELQCFTDDWVAAHG